MSRLLEISTDKVDAEVPAPVSRTFCSKFALRKVKRLKSARLSRSVGSERRAATSAAISNTSARGQKQAEEAAAQATSADVSSVQIGQTATSSKMSVETEGRSYDYQRPEAIQDAEKTVSNGNNSIEELRRTKSSPLVRNIAKEHGVDISKLNGSGMSGRVTKKDIVSFIDSGAGVRPQDLLVKTASSMSASTPAAPQTQPQTAKRAEFNAPQVTASVGDRTEPMSMMRKKIAEHMTFSKQTSAHVTSVYEFDMTNVAKFRDKNKAEFQSRYGTKLSYMPFIFQAVSQALRKFPIVNSQVSGDQIIYKGDINLGMAVALDWGLIVPVIKRADQLSLSGLALAANDLADRATNQKADA